MPCSLSLFITCCWLCSAPAAGPFFATLPGPFAFAFVTCNSHGPIRFRFLSSFFRSARPVHVQLLVRNPVFRSKLLSSGVQRSKLESLDCHPRIHHGTCPPHCKSWPGNLPVASHRKKMSLVMPATPQTRLVQTELT